MKGWTGWATSVGRGSGGGSRRSLWLRGCQGRRSSLRYVNYRDRRTVAAALRPIYTAANADDAVIELERFDAEWGAAYPMIPTAWREHWPHVTPFLALPDGPRRAVSTTNTIEALHRQVRKAIKTRGHFPDYFFDQPDVVAEFTLDKYWPPTV